MYTAFVTGAGSGFGRATTRRLLEAGHRVVASDLAVDGWERGLGGGDHLWVAPLDVRDGAAVARLAAEVLARWPVDVVVNNAGYGLFGAQEELPTEAFAALLDVNVLGPARVTRALLPSLRATGGVVVQLASVAGRTVFPESGFYAASKHALEAMSEALVQEVAPFGVRVRVIEPGSFDTRFLARAAEVSPPAPTDSPYAAARVRWTAARQEVLEPPQDPELVAAAIVASLDDPAPYRRIPVGPDAERILALRDALGPHAWTRLAADRAGYT
ncbi:MAG: SDR family oxidoreductase, partial [Myxococcota bacterium]